MRAVFGKLISWRVVVATCCAVLTLFMTVHVYTNLTEPPFNRTLWTLQHQEYIQLFQLSDPQLQRYTHTLNTVPATKRHLFPSKTSFQRREIGDCVNNGASEIKKLSPYCGCAPLPAPDPRLGPVHPCCREHLRALLRDVYNEVTKINVPLILLGGPVMGWYRNRSLISYDLDLDAGLPWEVWTSEQFNAVLSRLAEKGYCVWFRETWWTKVWSSVVAFDLFAWNLVDGRIHLAPGITPSTLPQQQQQQQQRQQQQQQQQQQPLSDGYNVSMLLPRQRVVLEGVDVFIPNQPRAYLDHRYGRGGWEKPLQCSKIEHAKCVE